MPNWKKVIVSGSDAALNSLNVTAHFTASGLIYPTASGTNGQVIVTDGAGKLSFSNSAISASYALTASFSQATTENKILVMNKSGATMAKGVVVHITGSNNSSDTPYVILASYENDNNSANTLGITSQTIANNDTGFVTTEGVLTGIDVTGFISGQLIYLGISGSITGSAPLPPLHSVRLGQVVRDSPSNNGAIYVRVDNGYEIGELHDVRDTTTTSSFGDLLVKSGSIWITSKQLTGSYGLTGSLSATSFTGSLLGTASFASTASFINVTGSNAFVQGGNSFGAQALLGTNDNQSLAFETSGSTRIFVSSSGLVGINKTTPNAQLDINGNTLITGSLTITGSTALIGSSTANAGTYTFVAASVGDSGIRIDNTINGYTSINWLSNSVGFGLMAGGGLFAKISNAAGLHIGQSPTSTYVAPLAVTSHGTTTGTTFLARNSAGTNILKVVDNGRVGINNANPTASLDVAGTTRISGSFNTAASGSILTVIGSGSAQPIFTVQGSQGELFSVTDSLSGSLYSVNDISGLPILEVFSDNTVLLGNYQDPMLITTTKLITTASGAFTLYALPTASYDTAFFEYSIKSGSNARAGSIMAIQSGTSVNFTETTTTDFGSTSGFGFTVQVSGANMLLTGSATTSGWTIKTIVRSI